MNIKRGKLFFFLDKFINRIGFGTTSYGSEREVTTALRRGVRKRKGGKGKI